MSLSSAGIDAKRMNLWTWHQFYSYVKFSAGADIKSIQDKFQAHVRKEIHPQERGQNSFPFSRRLKIYTSNRQNFKMIL
jgi:hypothetical protein